MTPERWTEIENLFHRAVECGPGERTALLDQTCSDDPELRREVEALLSCDGSARDNVQAAVLPAIEGFGFPLAGQVVSHYRVLEGLGGGGMGLVYRAQDVRLGRLVALKFLPEESANNPVALARFEREARAVSAVEHPNICPIYEFGEHEGRPFLVMQLLEGQTLRELLENRGSEEANPGAGVPAQRNMALALDQVFDLAIQIADGLQAAHQKGIIHRDIKPANIFVTNEGQVRILDFGLAKLAEDVAISDDAITANTQAAGERARNVDRVLSQTGVPIGTAGYMSPEQASGETLDRRTDIYSFGLVLYEMATGAPSRLRANTSCSVVRLVTSEPVTANLSPSTPRSSYQVIKVALAREHKRQLQSHVPRQLETLISRATERDRERRYQNISELASGLRTAKLERVSQKRRTRIAFLLLALALLAATAAPKIFRFAEQFYRLRQLQNLTLVPLTTLSGNAVAPAFSPDGRTIAFAWDGENGDQHYDLYVKPIGTEELHRLTKQPGMYHSAWSPDGRSIAFVRASEDYDHSGLFIIPSSGGPERKITSGCFYPFRAIGALAWSPDGKQIACIGWGPPPTSAQLFLVATDSPAVTPVETACSRPISPSFSPDGEYLSWTCSPILGGPSVVEIMRLGTRKVSRLLQRAETIGGPIWDPRGQRLLFSSNVWAGDIWEISFRDPDRLEKVLVGHDAFDLAFSATGDRLAFAQNHTNVNIWAVDVTGKRPDAVLLVSSSREQNTPAVSPDGSKIAFESNRSGANEIWVSDWHGSNSVQLSSFGIQMTGTPRWSPDGSLIAFDSRAGGESNIYLADPRGGRPRKLEIDIRGNSQPSWSRDGKWIYFVNGDDAQHPTCWKVPAAGGHGVLLTDGTALRPLESPDGRHLYFVRQPGGLLVRTDTDGHNLEEIRDVGPVYVGGWVPVDNGIYFVRRDNRGASISFFDFATRGIRPIYRLRKPPFYFGGMSVYRNWLLFPQLDYQTSDLVMIDWKKDAGQTNEIRTDTSTPETSTTLQSAQSPYIRMAETYRRAGKYDEAAEALKKASAIFPESTEVMYNQAVIVEAQGKYDESIAILNQLLQKIEHANGEYDVSEKRNRATFLERLGTVYREANKPEMAIYTFRRMLDLGDDNAIRGYQELIGTYRYQKQWQLATATAEEAARRFPADRSLQLVAAAQRADMGQSGPAIAQVKAMLKGTSDDREIYIALSQMYSRVKDWPQAEASINKALALSTKQKDKDYAIFVAGSIYARQKKYDLAEEEFRKVIASDPENAQALNYLGYMLADRGMRLEEALGDIRRAVALEPQNGGFLDSLGWVYYRLGNYDLAEENLSRASEKIGTDPTVQAHLGDLYQRTGRLQLATAHWQRALEEWNTMIPAEVGTDEVAKVQKHLESAKVKLAKQNPGKE